MIIAIALAFATISQPRQDPDFWKPLVTDKGTAIQVATLFLTKIYGKEQVRMESPLMARLTNGVWSVTGKLPAGVAGGTATIEIRASDCQVLRIHQSR